MSRTIAISSVLSALFFAALLAPGCSPGGIGDPCTPEDEYTDEFSGYSVDEVNVESRSFQCVTRICLVNHFQGRVSCPYGNGQSTINQRNNQDMNLTCYVPGDQTRPIKGAVDPQVQTRRANDAVYCSCRCKGPDKSARYCECPSGFQCENLVEQLDVGGAQLAGSYCIREGTRYDKSVNTSNVCHYNAKDCGDVDEINQPK